MAVDWLQNIQLGNIGGGLLGKLVGYIFIIMEFAVVLGIVIGGFIIYKRFAAYGDKVIILEKAGNNTTRFRFDRGGIIRSKGGIEEYRLLKMNRTMYPPSLDDKYTDMKGKSVVLLHRESEDNFVPINVKNEFGNLEEFKPKMGFTTNNRNLLITLTEKNIQRFTEQKWWEKYGNQIVLIGGMAVIMIMLFMVLGASKEILANAMGQASKIASALGEAGKQVVSAPPL